MNRKRRASLPDTVNNRKAEKNPAGDASKPEGEEEVHETVIEEVSDKEEHHLKRKRRVSEELSSGSKSAVASSSTDGGASLGALSVTPSTTATIVKPRVQDDRVKISEMFVVIRHTIDSLVTMCETNLRDKTAAEASPSKNLKSKTDVEPRIVDIVPQPATASGDVVEKEVEPMDDDCKNDSKKETWRKFYFFTKNETFKWFNLITYILSYTCWTTLVLSWWCNILKPLFFRKNPLF